MHRIFNFLGKLSFPGYLLKWLLITAPVSVAVGSLVALFLWLLDWATVTRWGHEWLLYALPMAGLAIHFLYKVYGKSSEKGNNLIIDEIHRPGGGVPLAMAPLVLVTTVVTHLFGGSAGREGTAVQIGGSIAHLFGRRFGLSPVEVKTLLMAGIAAGFGAVFGTPFAGMMFAMEVLVVGRVHFRAAIPCLMAAFIGDWATSAWGIHHTHYSIAPLPGGYRFYGVHIEGFLLLKSALAGIAFGAAAYIFAAFTHTVGAAAKKFFRRQWLVPLAGGLLVIALVYVSGTTDYLGLGVTGKSAGSVSIVSAFSGRGVTEWSWLWKIVFTGVTLGMGFKGGEVTPLFFIGATLGSALAVVASVPVDVFAGIGFIAVFAAATNTPLACGVMGIELFGHQYAIYFFAACFVAYLFHRETGIYSSQRIRAINEKSGEPFTLADIKKRRTRINRIRLYKGRRFFK
ncbi:MAG: voltage-gated chloride channel family protein [Flavipsychrobacter sp.]|nr:voltage-gated chloride channel family protein [Flavipsychrobacter sp.]